MVDIIQSYIIKGAIILIIIQAMLSLQQTLYERTLKAQLEQEMFQMSAVVTSDLRRVGSDTVSVRPYFIVADTNSFRFKTGDSASFAVTHVIDYTITKPDAFYVLNRSVDGGTSLPVGRNLIRFQMQYLDNNGAVLTPTPLSDPNKLNIRMISILAKMQMTTVTNDTVSSLWQTKIFPQNLPWF
jgi:hypothetical protein